MPRMTDVQMDNFQIQGAGSFQYSAARPDVLEASEYTLATVVVDTTGSVSGFKDDLLLMLKTVIKACKRNARSENIMLRVVSFNTGINEINGFQPVMSIDEDAYADFRPRGMTALYDATYAAIASTMQYGRALMERDFDANGSIYIITDGDDNASNLRKADVRRVLQEALKDEYLLGMQSILIGINCAEYSAELKSFADDADMTEFIDAGDATPETLAKVGAFISKSISITSQSLVGVSTKQLTF